MDASFTGMVNVMAGVCGASSSLCATSFYRKSAAAVLQSGRYFHSRHMLGDQALAEIGATAALYSLITNFAFGMNNGLALTVSRNFGAGNEKKMKQAVCWMTILSIGTALVLSGGFLLFQKILLELLKIPEENRTGGMTLCHVQLY